MASETLPKRWRINPRPSRPWRARGPRRLIVGIAVSAAALGIRGIGGDGAETVQRIAAPILAPPTAPGSMLFPRARVVGFYGAPQDRKLGILGIGTPDQAAAKLRLRARAYGTPQRPVIPAMELIAVIASEQPQADGRYRSRQPPLTIQRYLDAARRAHALLILDIQPGQSDFLSEAKVLEPYLKQPDVGLALDPEWHVPPGQIPGQSIGSSTATEVNQVADYLSSLVTVNRLPQKLLLVHEFTESMVVPKFGLRAPRGVAEVINIDGVGPPRVKQLKYGQLTGRLNPALRRGFKLFFHEDPRLMAPAEVLGLSPPPDVVIYE
ncbi:MAG: hypothetical protein QOJ38_1699 [Solirubrobacterales bacterium]|jgi:hypothetical protein|nr:hypothetical protein [Solirubrobacterales bacterium]